MTIRNRLANFSRQPQHKDQHLGDRLVKLRWNFIAEFDVRERPGQQFVLFDRDVVGLGDLDDLLADASPPLATTRGAPLRS
jgi:hypothetical protein